MSETSANATAAISAPLTMNEAAAIQKEQRLLVSLRQIDSLLIAFSGGAAGFLGVDRLHSFDYKTVKRFIAAPVEKSA